MTLTGANLVGVTGLWMKYVGLDGKVIGVDTFGESAPEPNAELRDVLVDKNRQYFRRYRPLNTFYYTGGRNKQYGYLDFLPAMRNFVPLEECLREAYVDGPTVHNPSGEIPTSEDIPLLLDRVYPAHEVVKIDYHLPGCPPSADTLWAALTALLSDEPVELPYSLIKYD